MKTQFAELKNKKIPKLRFSEFSDMWNEKRFSEVFSFRTTNSFSRENLNYESGVVKNIHYGDIHTKFKAHFDITKEIVPFINKEIHLNKILQESYCKEGDLIITDASEDYADIGKCIEIVNLNNEKVLAGLHTLQARPDLDVFYTGFVGQLMKTRKVHLQIMTIAQGTKVLSISTGRLSNIFLNFPSLTEQKKVSSFLESIDSWIESLKEQKESFESYKKGMMQKIFSQEIRFKDENNKNFPNWQEKKLGGVAKFWNGKAHEQDISEHGKYIVVNSKFISQNGEIKKYSDKQISPLKKDDIVIVMSDIPNGKAIGKCFLINEDNLYTLNQRIGGINSKEIISQFLIIILNRNKYFLKFDNGVSQTNLRKDDILECPITFPSLPEQHKIADFLASIDKLIELKQQQIIQAEHWKKGLMQELFV